MSKDKISKIDWKVLADIFFAIIILGSLIITIIWYSMGSLFYSIFTLFILLMISSVWSYYRKGYLRFVISLLLLVVLFYLLTYFLEFPVWSYIDFGNYMFHGNNFTFQEFTNSLQYESGYTRIYQKIIFYNKIPDNKTFSSFAFRMPEQTKWFNIKMYEWRNAGKLLINESNYTSLKNETYVDYRVLLEKTGTYNIETEYVMQEMDPYGSIRLSLTGYDVNPKTRISVGINFNNLLYDCLSPCIIVDSENANVTPISIYSYKFVNISEMERTGTHYSVVGNDADSLLFSIRTLKKYPLILRQISIGLISGLTIGMITVVVQKDNRKKYAERIKKIRKILSKFWSLGGESNSRPAAYEVRLN